MSLPFHELAAAAGVAFPLRTERLSIAPFSPADAAQVWEYWQLPQTYRWTTRSYADAAELAEVWLQAGSHLVIRCGGAVIGDCSVEVQDAWAQPEVAQQARSAQAELGWALHPQHSGHGYATEAIRAVIDAIFTSGVRRVLAECFAANEPSWRLMERLGMRREAHTVAESLHRDLGWIDGMTYALLASEWEQRRDRPT